MLIDIVIVNWNTGILLEECLTTLSQDPFIKNNARIIVVDNDSHDNSWAIAKNYNEQLVLLHRSEKNHGFAAACNTGAKLGNAKYLLFLNPDTQIPIGIVERSLQRFSEMPDVGVLGIRMFGDDQILQRSCARFPSLGTSLGKMVGMERWWPNFKSLHMQDWAHDESRAVNHVIGAYYLMERELFERMNGFDERFFVYLEDVDLSRRVHDVGLKVFYEADLDAYHLGGGSSQQIRAKRLYYSTESLFLYVLKHLGVTTGTIVIVATFLIEFPIRILRALVSGRLVDIGHILRAGTWLARSLPSVYRGRHCASLKGL